MIHFKHIILNSLCVAMLCTTAQASQLKPASSNTQSSLLTTGVIGLLSLTTAVLSYCVWKKKSPNDLMNDYLRKPQNQPAQKGEQNLAFDDQTEAGRAQMTEEEMNLHIAQMTEECDRRTQNLQDELAYNKRLSDETADILNKARNKSATVDFVLKTYALRNSATALFGMHDQMKRQSKPTFEALSSIQDQMRRLEADITTISAEKTTIVEDPQITTLQSTLKMQPAKDELNAIKASLAKRLKETSESLPQASRTNLLREPSKATAASKTSAARSNSKQDDPSNPALVFVTKYKDAEPHIVLGISPDALMPHIMKAYKALAKQYHPDKDGKYFNDQTEATKLIHDARGAMVSAFK